jgi:hypothetical protein
MTKTLNQIIFFPPPKSEYFFQQHWELIFSPPFAQIVMVVATSLKLLNQIKPNLAVMVPFKNLVQQLHPPLKMAAITKHRNFFNCLLLLYYKSKV